MGMNYLQKVTQQYGFEDQGAQKEFAEQQHYTIMKLRGLQTELGKNLQVTGSDEKSVIELKIIFTVYFCII